MPEALQQRKTRLTVLALSLQPALYAFGRILVCRALRAFAPRF